MPDYPRLIYFLLLAHSDSHGRCFGHPALLLHRFGPTQNTPTQMAQALQTLHTAGLVDWYCDSHHPSTQVFVQVGQTPAQYDESQQSTLKTKRGPSTIPARSDAHEDAHTHHLVTDHSQPSHSPVIDQSQTTPPQIKKETKKQKKKQTLSTGQREVLAHWKRVCKKKRELVPAETSRLADVLKVFSADQVKQYLSTAMEEEWWWQAPHRRDIATLFPSKGDRPWQVRIHNIISPETQETQADADPVYTLTDEQKAQARAHLLGGGRQP